MKYRFFLAIVCTLFLPLSGTGQETIHVSPDGTVLENPYGSTWGNPYPGLGNVSPGALNPAPSLPPSIMLYAEETNYVDLSPTDKSSDLYLARFPSGKRTGMFQKINFNTLWAPNTGGSQGLGITEIDLSAMFALPMPTPASPLLLTPKFSTTFFNSNGWNETFYTTGLGMRWIRPVVKDKFTFDLGFSVYYSGDFRVHTGDALRFPAHVAGIWQFNPRTKIMVGVVYTDRKDSYNVFPMAGLIWTPHDELSVELVVPRLRIAQRVRWFDSAPGDEQSDWLYTAFEFGGGSWGYDLSDSRIEYRDLRLLLGYERRTRIGLTLGLEVGYMFDRTLAVDRSGVPDGHPANSVFLRLRTSF